MNAYHVPPDASLRRAVRVEHANGSKPKSDAFPHLTGRAVVILVSAFVATTGPRVGVSP